MTWSMFAANYLGTSEYWRANEYFERGYKSYVRPEFKVWSETPLGYDGSANFLTGIGGFLQALIFGYGGLDFGRDGNKTVMFRSEALAPPYVTEVHVNYIRYGDSKCRFIFSNLSSTMQCSVSSGPGFEMVQNEQRTLLGKSFNCKLKTKTRRGKPNHPPPAFSDPRERRSAPAHKHIEIKSKVYLNK